jgi:hypothetical protein
MMQLQSFLNGVGFGAGMMYFFDPDRGRRRRSLARDQFVHAFAVCQRSADVLQRDARNRMTGMVAEAKSLGRRGQSTTDDVLVERVRARIGRAVSHPRAIEVGAHDGCVILSGPVLAHEVENLIDNVRWVRGVQRVENQLDVHDEAGNFSALQGGVERRYQPLDIMQENWSPTTRAAVGVGSAALMVNCMLNRSLTSMMLGTLGFFMATQAATRGRGAGGQTIRPSLTGQEVGRQEQWAGRSDGRSQTAGGDQSQDLPQRAAESPRFAETGTDPGAENRRSSADQPDQPAIHNL